MQLNGPHNNGYIEYNQAGMLEIIYFIKLRKGMILKIIKTIKLVIYLNGFDRDSLGALKTVVSTQHSCQTLQSLVRGFVLAPSGGHDGKFLFTAIMPQLFI